LAKNRTAVESKNRRSAARRKDGSAPRPIHCDLEVWKEAMRLARDVYRLSVELPVDERFGLTQQMRRSAVSVASNIAEGAGRGRTTEWIQFLLVARGSLLELDTQLWWAQDLGFIPADRIPRSELERLVAKLNAFISFKRGVRG
jgi:four helix bundle protein